MIKSLSVHNFKNLKDLHLSGLKRFNLILGSNNTGKSSLLESIYLLANAGDKGVIRNIIEDRGYTIPSKFDKSDDNEFLSIFSSLINGRDYYDFYKRGIVISSDIDTLKLRFVDVFEEYMEDNAVIRKTKLYDDDDDDDDSTIGERPALYIEVNEKQRDLYVFDRYSSLVKTSKSLYPVELVRTSLLHSNDNAYLFDKITMTSMEQELVSALRIIEPRITAINFIKSSYSRRSETDRIPYVLLDNGKRYQLSSMGDGVNRILTIVLSLLNCPDGVLLIDEFENGLHYSVQTQLWEVIVKVATSLNVQVFATTHSSDTIKSYNDSKAINDGIAIRLENDNDDIFSTLFKNRERLQFAIEKNIEIR